MRTHIQRSVAAEMPQATSVFIGGGTPTLVPADELMSVLAEIPLAPGAEVTVECNPDDITLAMLQKFIAGGVNRVSIGVQSTVDQVLKSLGRTHNPENVSRSVAYGVSDASPLLVVVVVEVLMNSIIITQTCVGAWACAMLTLV